MSHKLEFCDSLVKISLSQMLNHLGVDRIHSIALDFLVQVFNDYLLEVSQNAAASCSNSNRKKLVYPDLLFLDFEVLLKWYEQRQKLKLVKSKLQMLIDDSQELNPALPYFPRLLPGPLSNPQNVESSQRIDQNGINGIHQNDTAVDSAIQKDALDQDSNQNDVMDQTAKGVDSNHKNMDVIQDMNDNHVPVPTREDILSDAQPRDYSAKFPPIPTTADEEFCIKMQEKIPVLQQGLNQERVVVKGDELFYFAQEFKESGLQVQDIDGFVKVPELESRQINGFIAEIVDVKEHVSSGDKTKDELRKDDVIEDGPMNGDGIEHGLGNGDSVQHGAKDEIKVGDDTVDKVQDDFLDSNDQDVVMETDTADISLSENPIPTEPGGQATASQVPEKDGNTNGDGINSNHNGIDMEIGAIAVLLSKTTTLPQTPRPLPPTPRIVLRPPTRKKPDFDSLVIAASKDSKSTLDTTTPLISHSDLLTLLTFRSSGVAISSPSSSGYETKSIITDLTLLRTPSLWWLYGGSQDLEPGGKLASELYHMPRTRKKEKKRDNGQGKAPIKTAEQKLLRKEMMEQAANRKRQMLAEADIRREVKLLAKLEKAEAKGIRLDPQTAQKKMELKAKVGNIVLPKKETKRDRMKKEKIAMEGGESSTPAPKKRLTKVEGGGAMPVIAKPAPMAVGMPMTFPAAQVPTSPVKFKLNFSPQKELAQSSSSSNLHERVNCVCSNPGVDYGLFMVCCDSCNCWFHGSCVGVNQVVEHFMCVRCQSS